MSKLDEAQLEHLRASLQDLEYGSILITVHDGFITQIDTTEKKRFNRSLSLPKGRRPKENNLCRLDN